MRLLFTLALRNFLRHRRRTLLTLLALGLGIAVMSLSSAWTDAMERAVVDPAKDATLGHIEVFRADAAEDEGGEVSFINPHNQYRLLERPQEVLAAVLAAEPRLEGGLARLMVGALLSSGEKSLDGLLTGIDARARAGVYPALGLKRGRHFTAGEKGVLINENVARALKLDVGGELVALTTTADGRLNGVKLEVTGIWTIRGLEAYEWASCWADLETVQELLDVGAGAGMLVLRQRDPRAPSAPIAAGLNRAFAAQGLPYRAFTWEELGGPFIGGMMVSRFIAGIVNVMLAAIVGAGVLNTALMAVFERTREIGTLRAVGARKHRIALLFLIEACLLGLAGAALGLALGGLLIGTLQETGIPAFSEAQRYSYGGDRLYPLLEWDRLWPAPGLMLLVTVAAALGPALMAARLKPATALRWV